MRLLLLIVIVACAGAIVYVLTQGADQTFEVAGMAVSGSRAVAAAGLTLCGAAVLFAGLTYASMVKTAVWIGAALIVVGLATVVMGSPS